MNSGGERPLPSSHAEWQEALGRLEARVARLEAALRSRAAPLVPPGFDRNGLAASDRNGAVALERAFGPRPAEGDSLERRIWEHFLPQVGAVAFVLGVGFLVTYLYATWPPALACASVALLLAGFQALAVLLRRVYPSIRSTLFVGNLLLLYYAVLRLAFFSEVPIVGSKTVGLALLVAVPAFMVAISVARRTEYLAVIALFLGFATLLVGDRPLFTLAGITVLSAAAAGLRLRYDWDGLIVFALVGAYATHLLWLLGNPLLGHPLKMVAEPHGNVYFLFAYAAIFTVANLFRSRSLALEMSNILLSLFNAAGFYLISALVILTYWEERVALFNFAIAAFFLGVGVSYWLYRRSFYAASFYALTGLLALSVGILIRFSDYTHLRFILLGWQGVLVILLAIWFRSRIIAVANVGIVCGIYLYAHAAEPLSAGVNLNFAAVAVSSYFLLDRFRTRLELDTRFVSPVYLGLGLVATALGLYRALPAQYLSVAWLGAALAWLGPGVLARRRALRVVGVVMLLLAVAHVFLVDLARLEAFYRTVSFLALSLVLLVSCLVYGRHSRGRRPAGEGGDR